MKKRYGLAPLLLGLGLVWLVASGRTYAIDPAPQLVRVVDLLPRQVELGDRLAIVGDGFPTGKPARITFEGTLHRPGEPSIRGAQIVLTGTAVSAGQVHVAFGEATQSLFCGAGIRARHTTFEGNVEVAFAAAAPGQAPVAGVLRQLTLDVRPSLRASEETGDREGARLLGWIGMRAILAPAGLVVETVDPGSRAQIAGIEPGDIVTRLDEVRVGAIGDVVPAPGEREARVGLRRGGAATEIERAVSVEGFRRAPPAELVGAGILLLGALAVVLFFAAPTRVMRSPLLQRVASRLRSRMEGTDEARSTARRVAQLLGRVAFKALPALGPPAIVDLVAFCLLAILPFGQYLIAAKLDIGLLFVAAATALSAAALVASGSPLRGARAALEIGWQHVPAAVALASLVVTTGSLRIQEIERGQGGWPWDWLAFRSPGTLLSLGLLLASAAIELDPIESAPREASGLKMHLEDHCSDGHSSGRSWRDAACRAHRLVVVGLASALFLGGWLLPGWTPAEQEARPILELAGALCFLSKTFGLFFAMAWLRWALPRRRMAERSRATAIWIAPVAAGAFVATAAWTSWCPPPAEQLLISGTLVAIVALAGIAVGIRLRHGLIAAGADGRLSPFL